MFKKLNFNLNLIDTTSHQCFDNADKVSERDCLSKTDHLRIYIFSWVSKWPFCSWFWPWPDDLDI